MSVQDCNRAVFIKYYLQAGRARAIYPSLPSPREHILDGTCNSISALDFELENFWNKGCYNHTYKYSRCFQGWWFTIHITKMQKKLHFTFNVHATIYAPNSSLQRQYMSIKCSAKICELLFIKIIGWTEWKNQPMIHVTRFMHYISADKLTGSSTLGIV